MEGSEHDDSIATTSNLPSTDKAELGVPEHLVEPGRPAEPADGSDGAERDQLAASNKPEVVIPDDEDYKELGRELSQVVATLVSSGPIPNAGDLYAYTPDHQERIIRMAEASRTDESERRSEVVATQQLVIKQSVWIQAGLFGGCVAIAAVSFLVFNNPWGAAFLSLPILQFLGTLRKPPQ